jgi:hypothetical protein
MLHLVSEPTLVVTRACADQVRGHVTRRGTWVDTRRMDVFNRESLLDWVDRQEHRSSKEVSVNRIDRIENCIGALGCHPP